MKKVLLFLIIIMVISIKASANVYDSIMTEDFEYKISEAFESTDIDAISMIRDINSGKFDFQSNNILENIKIPIVNEFKNNLQFFVKTIALIFLVFFIENLYWNDKHQKLISLACTSVVVFSLLNYFYNISDYVTETIDQLVLFINSLIPILLTLITTSGHVATAGILNPVMLGVSSTVVLIVKSIILPFLCMGLALRLTYSITAKKQMLSIGNHIYSLIKWFVGLILTVYAGIITVIGIAAPNVDEITLKTAKFAVGSFVPYVGGMLGDSVELVLNCSNVVKNSVGVVGLIGIISVVAYPCIKIFIKILMFNILSVLISSVSNKSVSDAFGHLSSCLSMFLGLIAVVSVMYILSITVIINIGGA